MRAVSQNENGHVRDGHVARRVRLPALAVEVILLTDFPRLRSIPLLR